MTFVVCPTNMEQVRQLLDSYWYGDSESTQKTYPSILNITRKSFIINTLTDIQTEKIGNIAALHTFKDQKEKTLGEKVNILNAAVKKCLKVFLW